MIAGNAGSKVLLSILDLDMESSNNCRYDFVEVSSSVSGIIKNMELNYYAIGIWCHFGLTAAFTICANPHHRLTTRPLNTSPSSLHAFACTSLCVPYRLARRGQVYDGVGPSAVLKQRLCDTAPLTVIESTSNLMTVRMVTDIAITGRGFHARYRVGGSPSLQPIPWID